MPLLPYTGGVKMKINVHAGHTSQAGKSPGAGSKQTGIYESVEDRKIKNELIKILREKGHTVYDCTSQGNTMVDNLERIVKKCNAHKVDIDVSIHLNCYNGYAEGVETWIYSGSSKAKKAAEAATKNIAALGFVNRGVKTGPYLYVLRHTVAPAMLVECFFCDSHKDATTYKRVGCRKIAEAIAKAINTKTVKK